MTIAEMHTALKLELDKSDSLNNVSFEPEELDYWINKSIRRFVKTRYSGTNYKGQAFEQSQKRVDDLRTLVTFEEIDVLDGNDLENSHIAPLPLDYWFRVGEECEIIFNASISNLVDPVESGDLVIGQYYLVVGGSVTHNTEVYSTDDYFVAANTAYTSGDNGYVVLMDKSVEAVTEADHDTYRRFLDDPYSEHKLYYYSAKPLRLFRNESPEGEYFEPDEGTVILITDGNYYVTKYYLTYIREPGEVSIEDSYDSDLPEHAHDEIIDMAATLMIENIESQRIQTQPQVSINE